MRLVIICLVLLISGGVSNAATRLGLHYTQEELNVWRQRMDNGPYRVSGDVRTNSPGDWTRIANNATNWTLETWSGQPAGSCWSAMSSPVLPGRSRGEKTRDRAFVALVAQNATYRTSIRDALIAQAGTAGTDWTDTVRWSWNTGCATGDANSHDIMDWITKLLYAYDYIRADLTSGDQTIIDTWFLNGANFWQEVVDRTAEKRFPNRDTDDYTVSSAYLPDGNDGSTPYLTHHGGYTKRGFHEGWSNRAAKQTRMAALVGIMLDNATLKAKGKRWFKEWVHYHLFPDGTDADHHRWQTYPGVSWHYSSSVIGEMATLADAYARIGDLELYEYSSSTGLFGTAGGPKSLLDAITINLREMPGPNGDLIRYVPNHFGETNYIIDALSELENGTRVHDTYFALPNYYYRSSFIRTSYLRTITGAPSYPATPLTSGEGSGWGGPWNTYPGVLFMFGQMDGVVDPYNLSADTLAPNPPTGLTVSCAGSPTSCTLSATKASLNSDDTTTYDDPWGYRIRYCPNAACVPANGTTVDVAETGNLSNHVISGLTSDTLYRFDIASRDTAGNLSTFTTIQEDTTQAAPPPDLLVHLALDDGSGTSATDAAGHASGPHTGTLYEGGTSGQQGPSWVAGHVGTGALQFDGSNDSLRIAHDAALDFGAAEDFTVAVWVNSSQAATANQWPQIVNKLDLDPAFNGWEIALHDGNSDARWYAAVWVNDSFLVARGCTNIADGTWHHLAFRRMGDIIATYEDGNPCNTAQGSLVDDSVASGVPIIAGLFADGTDYPFAGSLDDLQVYDGAASEAFIAALAQGDPGETGVFAQGDWAWRWPQQPENGPFQRTNGYTNSPGQIVTGNHARVRLTLSRSVDTSALMAFVPYFRVDGGAWQALTDSCSTNAFCFGFDTLLAHGLNTTAQLVSANDFNTGGKFYEAFRARTDQISLAGGKSTEYEIVIRAKDDTAVGTTLGICLRQEDGTELDSCNEATAVVVAPMAHSMW